ncbi:MAG: hypothetical protein QM796_18490 [Chthoniobacteraceae bacterium]
MDDDAMIDAARSAKLYDRLWRFVGGLSLIVGIILGFVTLFSAISTFQSSDGTWGFVIGSAIATIVAGIISYHAFSMHVWSEFIAEYQGYFCRQILHPIDEVKDFLRQPKVARSVATQGFIREVQAVDSLGKHNEEALFRTADQIANFMRKLHD